MERKNLSLEQLSDLLNTMVVDEKINHDSTIEIPLCDMAMGPIRATTIASCSLGFDWDLGRIFLNPTDPLVSRSYMMDRLYGDWHPYPKRKPFRPGTYWVTVDDGEKRFCMETETLKSPDSSGKYPFYCTEEIVAWKEKIVPKPYEGDAKA